MKKWRFYVIAMVVFVTLSIVLTGCEIDGLGSDTGTLRIKNDTYILPDIIVKVTIRQGSFSGDVIVDDTVTIAGGQSKSYYLPSGTYAVNIRTDLLFPNLDKTVNITNGWISTLTYDDDNGFH